MRPVIIAAAVAILGAGGFLALTDPSLQRAAAEPVPVGAPDLANGEALFHAGGCASCHAAPGQDDRTRLSGGLKLASPYGAFVVPNISPHPRDGIGGWTDAQFVQAMRAGVSPDGRHYYPAFPYTSYQRMGAADLRDMFAYIRTLPVVEGRTGDHEIAFPYNIRRGLGLWKLAFLDGKAFTPDPAKPASWNRGAYLVEGPGHCAECHSPRNALGALVDAQRFAGGPSPDGKGTVPNITPHEDGVGGWSQAEMVELLTTGFTPSFDSVGGSMASVVKNTAALSDADREAMAEYLLSLPQRANAVGER